MMPPYGSVVCIQAEVRVLSVVQTLQAHQEPAQQAATAARSGCIAVPGFPGMKAASAHPLSLSLGCCALHACLDNM
jgi:hypothetical protein